MLPNKRHYPLDFTRGDMALWCSVAGGAGLFLRSAGENRRARMQSWYGDLSISRTRSRYREWERCHLAEDVAPQVSASLATKAYQRLARRVFSVCMVEDFPRPL